MSKIRFDGYYYLFTLKKNTYYSYVKVFRFFNNNNKVISVTHATQDFCFGSFFPSNDWFNENYDDSGNFKIIENEISFDCSSKHGKVSYKGTILNDDKLELFSHSYINGYEQTKIYKFIPFDVLKDIRDLDERKWYIV